MHVLMCAFPPCIAFVSDDKGDGEGDVGRKATVTVGSTSVETGVTEESDSADNPFR